MDESSAAGDESKKKKRRTAPKARPGDLPALAVVEVPPDPQLFEKALLLLQPFWVRAGGHILVWSLGAAALLLWPPSPETTKMELRVMLGIPCALLSGAYMLLRRNALKRQIEQWMKHASRAGGDRIELNEEGLVRGGKSIPWREVSDAAEIDYVEATLLAVRAGGAWIVLPASCFTQGGFGGARSLLMRKIGDKLRIVLV